MDALRLAAGGDQGLDLLGDRPHRAVTVRAAPPALTPPQPHRHLHVRHVAQYPHRSVAAERNHPPHPGRPHQLPRRRDRDNDQLCGALNRLDMDAIETEQQVTA